MSVAFFFTHDMGVYYFSAFLNLLFAGATLLVFAAFLRERMGDGLGIVGALLFALCLPVWAAVGSGMETCLMLLIYVAIWVVTERLAREEDRRWTRVLCALTILSLLSRADGFLMPGAAIACLMLKRRMRPALACSATLVTGAFFYELWRYHYYGYLLPNTYYTRVTGPLLWRASYALAQFHGFATHGGLLPYLLAFLILGIELAANWWRKRPTAMEPLGFELFLAAGWIAYWFFVGGDYIGERFLLILFPLGIFSLLKLVKGTSDKKVVALLAILVALFGILPIHWLDHRFHYSMHRYDSRRVTGEFLREHYPGKSVMTDAVGKVPFLADTYTVDILGLIDPVIAHAPPATREFDPGHVKFNIDHSLSKKPDLIVEGLPISGPQDPYWGQDSLQKFKAAGYRLRHLVYTGLREPPEPILNTRDMPEEAITRSIEEGYNTAILVRDGAD
jgi:hypothetical protein